MMEKQRYHPLMILYDLFGYIKSVFFIVIILFVFNYGSQSFLMKYGRYAFYLITVLSLISIILKWLTCKYKLGDTAFHFSIKRSRRFHMQKYRM
jgi:putative membrane protein